MKENFADYAVADLEQAEQPEAFDLGERFWLRKPYFSEEFGQEVLDRFTRHAEAWTQTHIGQVIWRAYSFYHNLDTNSQGVSAPDVGIGTAGEEGEFLTLSVNHYRGLVRHQLALVTADRPTWDPQARTTDAESARQSVLCRQLLDFVMGAKRFDQKIYNQMELGAVVASGFLALGWDANAGRDGSGDVWGRTLAPWEVAHERVRDYADTSWWVFRAFESRWDWAAKFETDDPEKARKIADLDLRGELFSSYFLEQSYDFEEDSDRLAVLYVYAKPTKACPEGRMSIVTAGNIVLFDGPMPYGEQPPIERICPAEFLGTSIPYADSWSLLSSSEAYNAVMSTIMTRVDAHGIPSVSITEGTEWEADDFYGQRLIKTPMGGQDPKLVDMLQVPNALPALLELVKKNMEELSGINSVTRGNPSDNITSGSMAALLQSMAIQFNSPMERSYTFNLEAVGTHLLRIYQRMATEEQLISITGKDQAWTTRSFRGEDLKQVLRVAVRSTAALSKTTAGRKELADQLLQRNMIQDPREYMKLVATGELESLFSGPAEELNNIKSENEALATGQKPPVSLWDNHQLHIREHKGMLDTQARFDRTAFPSINEHLMEHMQMWSKTTMESPDVLMASGCPPLPMAQSIGAQAMAMKTDGMAPPMPPQAGPSPQKQPNTEEPAKPGPAPSPPGQEQGAAPRLPSQPKDPLTGEQPGA